MVLHRILGGNDQEGLRQRVRVRVYSNLAFIHGFEQGRLCLGSCAIDFVGQQDVGENRSTLELKLLFDGGVDRDAKYIRWQHVAGELYALEAAVDGPGQRLAEGSLAHARDTFNQQVSARQHRNQRQADDIVLTANYFAEGVFQLRRALGRGDGGFGRHQGNSTMHVQILKRAEGVTNVTGRRRASDLGRPTAGPLRLVCDQGGVWPRSDVRSPTPFLLTA